MISRTDIEDMTDAQDEAPERIWTDRISDEIKGFVDWSEGEWSSSPFDGATEYLRADLARPSQAGDERVARLIERADEIDPVLDVEFDTQRCVEQNPYGATEAIEKALYLIRDMRAALAAMDTPKGGGGE